MKKEYVRPMMVGEEFVANEYCTSTCGKTTDGKYIFTCDADAGDLYYYSEHFIFGEMKNYRGAFTPCEAKHYTDSPDVYHDGFVDYNNNGTEDSGEAVLFWEGPDSLGRRGHATKSLTREQIETERS